MPLSSFTQLIDFKRTPWVLRGEKCVSPLVPISSTEQLSHEIVQLDVILFVFGDDGS